MRLLGVYIVEDEKKTPSGDYSQSPGGVFLCSRHLRRFFAHVIIFIVAGGSLSLFRTAMPISSNTH